ncbi:MAG: ATP synthase F1 subunit epsilon [Clostridia bacterium]|nr:ATP synthase F1 subunit epsilon [Clostridia bacterium]
MKSFHLKIATPDGLEFEGEVESLLVRTAEGDAEILAGHTDFLSSLGTGRVRITAGGEKRFASASGGFVSVKGGDVSLVPVTFEFADDIDVKRAKAAKEKAEAELAAADKSAEALLKAKLARAINRINVWELNK